nr:hypothetical protein [uncultured Roseateles sp.]
MFVLRDAAAVEAFLASSPDAELHGLIAGRVQELSEYDDYDLSDLVNFIVMEASEPVSQLDTALSFPALINRFDGHAYGSAEFTPSWEDLADHSGWYEMTYVLRDDGFGLVVFIQKHPGLDPGLNAMCARYARTAKQTNPEVVDP